MKRLFISSVVFLVCAFAALGQSIKVQVTNLVSLNEQFKVTFSVSGENIDDFQWTQGDDFKLVWGPTKSTSSSVSMVNGKVSSNHQVSYSYILMPKQVGKFTIPAASAVIDGKNVSSRSCTVEVVADGAAAASSPSSSSSSSSSASSSSPSTPSPSSSGQDAFISLSFDHSSVMVGETVTATLKIYSRSNLAGFEDAKFPSFEGFWSEELPSPSTLQFQREKVGDKIYDAAVLRRWALTPRKAGEIAIEPSELVCVFNVSSGSRSTGSILDPFYQDEMKQVRRRLTTPAKTIKVAALPSGAPASFSGAVGAFSMTTELTKSSLKTHEAASLIVTLSGKGNMAMIQAPTVNFPLDFEEYDVKVTDKNGAKVFEYPFIPRSNGDFVIEPVQFSYYDLASHSYRTLSGDELSISVEKGAYDGTSRDSSSLSSGIVQKEVMNLGSDIRFISTLVPSFNLAGDFFIGSSLFWIIISLMAVAGLAVWALLRGAAARRADVVATRGRGATKMARKRLSAANGYLKGNLGAAFYEELHRALLGYVGDRFNMESADMNRDNIRQKMTGSSIPDSAVADFEALLDACEFARYAPDSGSEAMKSHYESAVSVISTIDSYMKKIRRPSSHAAVIIAILMLGLPFHSKAAAAVDSLWTAGCENYSAGDWYSAADNWKAIEETGMESPELYYNLGNAYFKADRLAYSILYYRRALQLDPAYSDARFNLEFARARCVDKLSAVPEFFLTTWTREFCYSLNSDIWAVLFAVFFAVMVAALVIFGLVASKKLRRTGFFSACVALLFAALCLAFSLWQKNEYAAEDQAVVVKSVSSVKSSPGDDMSTSLFLLHEGTEVELIESVGDWNRISLSDGRQGWVKSSDIQVI